jgi:MFS family permease
MKVRYALALALCFFVNLAAGRVILSLYALHLGAGPFAVGVVMGMFYVFPVLLSWPVGVLSDRLGARGLLGFAAVCGGIGLLIPYFVGSMAALYAASALCGLALAFYNVILQSLIGILSAPHERTRNFANLSLAGSISNAVGPLLAGYSMDQAGPALASLYMVVPSMLAALLLAFGGGMLPGGSRAGARKTRLLDALNEPGIWHMLAVSALVQLGMDLFQFFIPVYGHSKGLSSSAIGIALASFAAAMFFVRVVLPRMAARMTEEALLSYSLFLSGLGYLLIPLSESATGLALIAFVFGLGMGSAAPLTMILIFSRSTEGRSGETLGLRLTTNNLVRVIGPTLFGLIASVFGLLPVFVISALLMGGGGLLSRPGRLKS